jgi:hypothetical protein
MATACCPGDVCAVARMAYVLCGIGQTTKRLRGFGLQIDGEGGVRDGMLGA